MPTQLPPPSPPMTHGAADVPKSINTEHITPLPRTTTVASRAPPSSPSIQAKAPLSRGALAHIIPYLPTNAAGSGTRNSAPFLVEEVNGDNRQCSEPFVSAESLFAKAVQAPSAAAAGLSTSAASASTLTQWSSAAAMMDVTRPLALLAASPHCRRALEEHLTGGCVLSPLGALVLQVCQYDPGKMQPHFDYRSSFTIHDFEGQGNMKTQRHRRKNNKKGGYGVPCAALQGTASAAAAECPQQLVVTSTNVSLNMLPAQSLTGLSHSPARPDTARTQQHSVASSSVTTSPALPPVNGISPRQNSTFAAAAASPNLTSPTAGLTAARDNGTQLHQVSPCAGAGDPIAISSASSVTTTVIPTTPRATRMSPSAVLQSRRVPMRALPGAAAAFLPLPSPTAAVTGGAGCGGPASSTLSPSSSQPSSQSPSPRAVTSISATTAKNSDSNFYQGGSPRGQRLASTPPLRPISFTSSSPRHLSSPTALPKTTEAPGRDAAGASAFLTPPSPRSPLTVPPALQALCLALWWLRRGPLPVSLSLLRYAESDIYALWNMLRTDTAIVDDKGENEQDVTTCAKCIEGTDAQGLSSVAATAAAPPSSVFSPLPAPKAGEFSFAARGVKAVKEACAKTPASLPSKANAAGGVSPSLLMLPSLVMELHVHGRAADAAVAAFLPGHPEVRSVRLTHASLSETQLRHLSRYCPDVTHLSLAMNACLRSTSFLCPTPTETSSVATSTTTATTATTNAATMRTNIYKGGQQPLAEATIGSSSGSNNTCRSPRASLLLHRPDLCSLPQQQLTTEECSTSLTPSSWNGTGFNGKRDRLSQQPAIEAVANLGEGSAQYHLGVRAQNSEDTFVAASAVQDDKGELFDGAAQSARSDASEGTAHSYSYDTQASQPLSTQSRQHLQSVSCEGLHNSQVDLFAAEEEGEAEMRFSLWQAAQTDTAERRQAVFILRPSDVVLGDASGGETRDRKRLKDVFNTKDQPDDSTLSPTSSHKPSSAVRHAISLGLETTADDPKAVCNMLVMPITRPSDGRPSATQKNGDHKSFNNNGGDENKDAHDDDVVSTVTANSADTTALLPPSMTSTTKHTDPLNSPGAPIATIDATLAELKTALRKPSVKTPSNCATAKDGASKTTITTTLNSRTHTASPASPLGHGHAPHHNHLHPHSTYHLSKHWSETLVDLDLSYTQVLDEDAARDVPQLRMLRRLSLEGCMQLSQVRWLPSLQYLRELNLSFSSVRGSALYPLGSCPQLVWLKLEGCSSLTRLDQLWEKKQEGFSDEEPTHTERQGQASATTIPTTPSPPSITFINPTSTARVVRHRAAGGIPAITVFPASTGVLSPLAAVAAAEERGENEMHTAPMEVHPPPTTTATSRESRFSSSPLISSFQSTDDTVIAAPLMSTLRVLIVTSTGLNDAGLFPVQHIVSLECLLLDRCPGVTDVNITAQLPSLHTLDASHTSVTAEGLFNLRQSRTLRQLRLQGCLALTRLPALFVEPVCSGRRADGVPGGESNSHEGSNNNSSTSQAAAAGLRVLDVSQCSNLTANGVEGLVVDTVAVKIQDASASVDGRRVTEAQRAATTAVLSSARYAEGMLYRNAFLTPPPVLPQLRHLLLRSCDAVAQLSALRGFTQVVELDLYHTSVDEASLTAATAWWTCLEVLNAASTRVRSLAAWCPAEDTGEKVGGGVGDGKSVQQKCDGDMTAAGLSTSGGAKESSSNGMFKRGTSGAVASPAAVQKCAFPVVSRLPRFAATLRVLLLSNTGVTSDGLLALRHFPRLEVLQLSNCRNLTSLSFLVLHEHITESPKRRENEGKAPQRRTALRELTVTEATNLTNTEIFPYIAACTGLRSLSLAGCAQVGSGVQTSSSSLVSLATPSTPGAGTANRLRALSASSSATAPGLLPPLVGKTVACKKSCCNSSGEKSKNSGFAALRCMGGLTDLNLSRTAVTQDDLRALLRPPLVREGGSPQAVESIHAARASTRLNLLSTSLPQLAKSDARAVSPVLRREWHQGGENKRGVCNNSSYSTASSHQQHRQKSAVTSLQRIWLRGCRFLDEDALLNAAAGAEAKAADASSAVPSALSSLASVREVYLSQGRCGAGVLSGLLS